MKNLHTLISTLKNNTETTQDTLSLYMNYLAVVYALFLPISWQARATIFLLILILFLIRRNYKYYISQSFKNQIVKAFLAYFAIHFIWLIGTENFTHAKKMIQLSEYAIIPFIFLTFLTKEFGKKMIAAFILSVFFNEILSYLIRFEIIAPHLELFNYTIYKAVSVLNPTPYLLHMHYTITLSIVISILMMQMLNKKLSIQTKLFLILFIISATVNLTLIEGRSGYLSYIVLMISIAILTYKKKAFLAVVSMLILISFVAQMGYSYSPSFKKRIDYTIDSAYSFNNKDKFFRTSSGVRIALWKYSIDSMEDNLIFGHGTGDQLDEMHKKIPNNYKYLVTYHHQHNMFIEVFTQFGILGLIVFLNIFYQIFKYKNSSSFNKNIMILISIGIIIAMLTETFSAKYYLAMFTTLISANISLDNKDHQLQLLSAQKEYLLYLLIIIFTLSAMYLQ